MRYLPLALVFLGWSGCLLMWNTASSVWWGSVVLLGGLVGLGLYDLLQPRHTILRNFPLLGHFRYMFESIRPEIHQYFIENNIDGRPYDRLERTLIYERAKDDHDVNPFGTDLDVYAPGAFYMRHSLNAKRLEPKEFRVDVGGESCTQPYSASILNVSAMSFGALGGHAIEALNEGARRGSFYHCTGEGGVSPYHLKHGGDLVWQVGTGYFGCRTDEGAFSSALFEEVAQKPQVKMIELKLSQGAKPGHGGVLPGSKVTKEIAQTRKIKRGQDCISPPAHSAFSTPEGLCEFLGQLRNLSGGKPVGFKLCIGFESEFFSICKAFIETGISPDFITVDGAEGGTGAAPLEFSDHMGVPLLKALHFVHQSLIGCGLRDRLHLAASGKVYSAMSLLRCVALGADWCNAARAFMMSIGCIQAKRCHTNTCPAGVATLDPGLQRGLVPEEKAGRAYMFHQNTMKALREILGAAGVNEPKEIGRKYFYSPQAIYLMDDHFSVPEGAFLEGKAPEYWQTLWDQSRPDSFVSI